MVNYTRDDMHILQEMALPGSPAEVFLHDLDFDPIKFKEFLESYDLKRDVELLFELPLTKVGLLINQGNVSGYLKFRLKVGK